MFNWIASLFTLSNLLLVGGISAFAIAFFILRRRSANVDTNQIRTMMIAEYRRGRGEDADEDETLPNAPDQEGLLLDQSATPWIGAAFAAAGVLLIAAFFFPYGWAKAQTYEELTQKEVDIKELIVVDAENEKLTVRQLPDQNYIIAIASNDSSVWVQLPWKQDYQFTQFGWDKEKLQVVKGYLQPKNDVSHKASKVHEAYKKAPEKKEPEKKEPEKKEPEKKV